MRTIVFTVLLCVGGVCCANAQDVEALLTQIALNQEAAKTDLRRAGQAILPKLLDYAQKKEDPFISYMAAYALQRVIDRPDVAFLEQGLRDPARVQYAVRSFELLGPNAISARKSLVGYVLDGTDADARARLARVIGSFGIEAVFQLDKRSPEKFSSEVRSAARGVFCRASFELIARSLDGGGPFTQGWASAAMEEIVDEIAESRRTRAEFEVPAMRPASTRFAPLPLPELSSTSDRNKVVMELFKSRFTRCLSTQECKYGHLAAWALAKLGDRWDLPPDIWSLLLINTNQEVRWTAAVVLAGAGFDNAGPPELPRVLAEALISGPVTARRDAAKALASKFPKSAILAIALSDSDREVRWDAARAFVDGRDPTPALNVFVELLADKEQYFTGAEGLAAAGAAAVPQIKNALHADAATQSHALFAVDLMRRIPEVRALVRDIVSLLDDQDSEVEKDAASTLSSLDARLIAEQASEIERHLPIIHSSVAREYLVKALQNIHRLTLSSTEALADLVASDSDEGTQVVIDLASRSPVTEETLQKIEQALLHDSNHRILWTWIEPVHKPLIELFARQMKYESDATADQIATLFLRLDHDDAIDTISDQLRADPAAERPLRWLESALPHEERYTEIQKKVVGSISSALVKRLLTSRPADSANIVRDLLKFSDFADESWMMCRENYRDAWKDSEPAKTLSNTESARTVLRNLLSTVGPGDVRNTIAMLLILSGEAPESIAEDLRAALDDRTPYVAEFAAGMLLRETPGDSRAVLRLIEHDARENFNCTSQIFENLHDAKGKNGAVHALEALASDARESVRYYAATTALDLDPKSALAKEVLVSMITTGDDRLRIDAVRALVKAHTVGMESTAVLISSLYGGSGADREWAIEGLKVVGEPAYPALLRAASTTTKDGRAVEAAKALGEVFGDDHVADFEVLLRNKDTEWIGLTALRAIGAKAKPARESIARIVAEDGPMAGAAARVMFQIDPTDTRTLVLMCSAAVTDEEVHSEQFDVQDALSSLGSELLPGLTRAVQLHRMTTEVAAECYGRVVSLLKVIASEKAATLTHSQPVEKLGKEILALSAAQFLTSPEELLSFFERTSGDPEPTVRDAVPSVICSLRDTALAASRTDGLRARGTQSATAPSAHARKIKAFQRLETLVAQRLRTEPVAFVRADLLLIPRRLPNPSPRLWHAVIVRLSSDRSARVRQAAAVALASASSGSDAAGALINAVSRDPAVSVRRVAADTLLRIPLNPSQVALIGRRLMTESNQSVLEALLEIVARFNLQGGPLNSAERLFRSTSDAGLRRAASRALGTSAEGTRVLLAVAEDQSSPSDQRYAAIEALPSPSTESVYAGFQRLLTSTDSYIKYLTLRRLASLGPNTVQLSDAIAGIVATSSTRERVAAIQALGKLLWLTDSGRAALIRAVHDEDEFVRAAAAAAMADLGSQASPLAPELVVLLKDPTPRARSAAAYAFREINPKRSIAIDFLIRLLDDPDVEVRRNAIAALGSYGALADTALPKLRSVTKDLEVGLWADCAINRIEGRNLPNLYGSMEYRSAIPALPDWPPPRPSTQDLLDDAYFMDGATLSDTYYRLRSALHDRHYDIDVMGAPGGFALASRIERYDPATGSSLPEPQRWSDQPSSAQFDLASLKRFFAGENLHFRIFLFVVSDRPFNAPVVAGLGRELLQRWVYARAEMLPSGLEKIAAKGHRCAVFVYSFSGKQRQFKLDTDALSAQIQLEHAGITRFLDIYATRR